MGGELTEKVILLKISFSSNCMKMTIFLKVEK